MAFKKTLFFTLLLLAFLSEPLLSANAGYDTIPGENPVEKELTIPQLEEAFQHFKSDDYIRSVDPEEDRIKRLINQSEKLNYSRGIALGNNLLGVIYRDRAEYAKAIEMHEKALSNAGTDTTIIIYALNNLGVVYRRLDKPKQAIDYHMQALNLAESFPGSPDVAKRSINIALNSIGNINLSMGQPEKALEVFKQSLKLEVEQNNNLGIAINYQNMGLAYEQLGKPDVALEYYQKSLRHNEIINSNLGRSICYNSIGEILFLRGQLVEALEHYQKALVYSYKTEDDYHISETHANLGNTYLKMGQPERALPEIEKFNEIAHKTHSGFLLKNSYKLLSDYYETKGEYKNAIEAFKTSVLYNDSIINERNTRYLTELQTIYEAEKKQQHIELLTKENQIKSQQLFVFLLLVLLLFFIVIFIFIFLKRQQEKQRVDLEMKLFRSLMNPHFIFNALASIQSFLYHNDPEKAATYLGYFSKLTRSILKNSTKDLISLDEEISMLKNYIEIEQMRKRNGFTYEIIMDDAIEPDFVFVPPMVLQPFVENAIHHGLGEIVDGSGKITVKLLQSGKTIRVEISDNGCGINASMKQKENTGHKSMGIGIFKERIRLIRKKFKKSVKFAIVDLNEIDQHINGTRVTLDFPLLEPND
ncbi:MAG: tetratricopeptide repeat protein [Prolixibacteraceae bacterium]|nr:tetratricopeptide repeat protein [Prolixibacteraceae bacterium]